VKLHLESAASNLPATPNSPLEPGVRKVPS
jgi:hypothetical protein